jgi:hypothetical protein
MTQTPNPRNDEHATADLPHQSTPEAAGRRGRDDRKGEVNPADNPAPSSPEHDDDAVRKGAERLNSVSPH